MVTVFGRLLAACCMAALLAMPGAAGAQGIEIVPASAAVAVVAPRAIVTVALRVTNHGPAGEFTASLALPPGWRPMAPEQPFTLAHGASTVRLVSTFVPETAAAGVHVLPYSVRGGAVHNDYALHVQVAPSVKLALSTLDVPDTVLAGAVYSATFLLQNRGNAPVTVDYKAHSSHAWALDLAPGALTLAPGASHTFVIAVASTPVTALERDWLILTAQPQSGGAAERATGVVKVIPSVSGTERRFTTVPATAAVRVVSETDNGQRHSTVQALLAGGGKLDEDSDRYLDFLLRGPGGTTTSAFGELSEYRVAYHDTHVALGLGDLNYSLSPLTEAGSYGRGVSAGYQDDTVAVHAYAMKDRYTRLDLAALPASGPIASQVAQLAALAAPLAATALTEQGVGVDVNTAAGRVGVNLLHKTDYRCTSGGDVASVRDQAGGATGWSFDAELASSSCDGAAGRAWGVTVADRTDALSWRASITRADAAYAGYNPDQQLAMFNADYPLTARLSLHASYHEQTTNLLLDPRRAAFNETHSVAGAGYQFDSGLHADLDVLTGTTVDLRALPDYDASHRAVQLSLREQVMGVRLYGSAALGTTEDHLLGQRFPSRQLLTTAYWPANDHLALGANYFYVDNVYSVHKEEAQQSVGVTVRYQFSERTAFDADAQANRSGLGGGAASLALSHRLHNGDVMTLALRSITAGATRQGDLMLSYAVPVTLPVGRRRNVATVNGRVIDQASGQGVAGTVLRLDGILAVSGANGAFSFPSIPLGQYFLSMDDGAGFGAIASVAMPMAVEVKDGADTQVAIALVQAATFTGKVALPDTADAPAPGLLHNLLVSFRKDDVAFNRLTDADGNFRLGSIAPGQWTVSVDPATVPDGYLLEQEQFVVDLAPGAQAAVAFRLKVKVRVIRMQQLKAVGN